MLCVGSSPFEQADFKREKGRERESSSSRRQQMCVRQNLQSATTSMSHANPSAYLRRIDPQKFVLFSATFPLFQDKRTHHIWFFLNDADRFIDHSNDD